MKDKIKRTSFFRHTLFAGFLAVSGLSFFVPGLGTGQASEKTPTTMGQNLPILDTAAPPEFETASFGLGWFWGIESRFGIIEGVIRTRVGYAGGKKEAPTYRAIGDHTETVQVDYDPSRISFTRLLEIIWESHRSTGWNGSGQYMNVIFYHSDKQHELALASKTALQQKLGRSVTTAVLPLRSFTMAEDYHQKYILKQHTGILNEISRYYPRHEDLVASTAATRLNGYTGGNGTRDQLDRELEKLGLSDKGKHVLTNMVAP